MEVPRLGAESELKPLTYTAATAMLDLSYTCDLHHRWRQGWILNPLSEARGGTCVLMDASQFPFRWARMVTPTVVFRFHLANLQRDFFFLFWPPQWHMEFPGQGSDPSLSCATVWTYTIAVATGRSFNPLYGGWGWNLRPWHFRDTTNPVVPQQEILILFLNAVVHNTLEISPFAII